MTYPGTLRPLWAAAQLYDRDLRLLRRWRADGRLEPKACHVPTRALLFDLREVAALDATTSRRRRVGPCNRTPS